MLFLGILTCKYMFQSAHPNVPDGQILFQLRNVVVVSFKFGHNCIILPSALFGQSE